MHRNSQQNRKLKQRSFVILYLRPIALCSVYCIVQSQTEQVHTSQTINFSDVAADPTHRDQCRIKVGAIDAAALRSFVK